MTTKIWPSIADAVKNAAQTAVAPLVWDPTNHLLSRFTFGPTFASRTDLSTVGPDCWYADQVAQAKKSLGYAAVPALSPYCTMLRMSPYDLDVYLTKQGKKYHWDAMDQLTRVTLGLQATSPAQLYETLVDFWSNHLNVPNHSSDMWNTRPAYDREIIRKYAATSFTDMLIASSKHPAMLSYLSLGASTKETINENYAREVLELHTVGLRYSESDVRNAARMLTGRTTDDYGHYVFDDYIHATGAITVLGFTHANSSATGGEAAGDAMLSYLASHPYTAQNLAQKLCVRYVSDNPSPELVAAVAQAYLDNKTQILPMIRTILCSDEFWSSRGQKVRRPTENLLATVRILGITPANWPNFMQTLHWTTSAVGNAPLDWPAPNGYPDVATAWRSSGTLLQLWNDQLGLASGWWPEFTTPDFSQLYGGVTPATSGAAIDLLTKNLTGLTWTTEHRNAVVGFLGEPATTPMSRSAMSWLATSVVAMILNAPHHALR